jgi:hypothetical protein
MAHFEDDQSLDTTPKPITVLLVRPSRLVFWGTKSRFRWSNKQNPNRRRFCHEEVRSLNRSSFLVFP